MMKYNKPDLKKQLQFYKQLKKPD